MMLHTVGGDPVVVLSHSACCAEPLALLSWGPKLLQVLMQVLPALGNPTAAGLHILVPALVANLGSSNSKIAARAGDVLDQLMLSVNPTLLIQVGCCLRKCAA